MLKKVIIEQVDNGFTVYALSEFLWKNQESLIFSSTRELINYLERNLKVFIPSEATSQASSESQSSQET